MRHVRGPHAQFEVERTFAESLEDHRWRRALENVWVASGNFEEQLLHHVRIAVVTNPYLDAKAYTGIDMRPIDHPPGNELRIRHNDHDIVIGQHMRGASADA